MPQPSRDTPYDHLHFSTFMIRKIGFLIALSASLGLVTTSPVASLALLISAPVALRFTRRKAVLIGGLGAVVAVVLYGLPVIAPGLPGYIWLLAAFTALALLVPSSAEVLPLARVPRALWKDLLLLTALLSLLPQLLRLPASWSAGMFEFLSGRPPSLYMVWGFIVAYVGMRQWSLNVPIRASDASVPTWRNILVLGGRLVVSLWFPFLVLGPWIGETARILAMMAVFVWAVFRLTYFLRLCVPGRLRLAVDLPLAVPGLLGVVAVGALYLSGAPVDGALGSSGELGGGEIVSGEAVSGEAAVGGPDGFDATDGSAVNDLGIPLGELETVDGYVTADGVVVESYVRTVADDTPLNNLNV